MHNTDKDTATNTGVSVSIPVIRSRDKIDCHQLEIAGDLERDSHGCLSLTIGDDNIADGGLCVMLESTLKRCWAVLSTLCCSEVSISPFPKGKAKRRHLSKYGYSSQKFAGDEARGSSYDSGDLLDQNKFTCYETIAARWRVVKRKMACFRERCRFADKLTILRTKFAVEELVVPPLFMGEYEFSLVDAKAQCRSKGCVVNSPRNMLVGDAVRLRQIVGGDCFLGRSAHDRNRADCFLIFGVVFYHCSITFLFALWFLTVVLFFGLAISAQLSMNSLRQRLLPSMNANDTTASPKGMPYAAVNSSVGMPLLSAHMWNAPIFPPVPSRNKPDSSHGYLFTHLRENVGLMVGFERPLVHFLQIASHFSFVLTPFRASSVGDCLMHWIVCILSPLAYYLCILRFQLRYSCCRKRIPCGGVVANEKGFLADDVHLSEMPSSIPGKRSSSSGMCNFIGYTNIAPSQKSKTFIDDSVRQCEHSRPVSFAETEKTQATGFCGSKVSPSKDSSEQHKMKRARKASVTLRSRTLRCHPCPQQLFPKNLSPMMPLTRTRCLFSIPEHSSESSPSSGKSSVTWRLSVPLSVPNIAARCNNEHAYFRPESRNLNTTCRVYERNDPGICHVGPVVISERPDTILSASDLQLAEDICFSRKHFDSEKFRGRCAMQSPSRSSSRFHPRLSDIECDKNRDRQGFLGSESLPDERKSRLQRSNFERTCHVQKLSSQRSFARRKSAPTCENQTAHFTSIVAGSNHRSDDINSSTATSSVSNMHTHTASMCLLEELFALDQSIVTTSVDVCASRTETGQGALLKPQVTEVKQPLESFSCSADESTARHEEASSPVFSRIILKQSEVVEQVGRMALNATSSKSVNSSRWGHWNGLSCPVWKAGGVSSDITNDFGDATVIRRRKKSTNMCCSRSFIQGRAKRNGSQSEVQEATANEGRKTSSLWTCPSVDQLVSSFSSPDLHGFLPFHLTPAYLNFRKAVQEKRYRSSFDNSDSEELIESGVNSSSNKGHEGSMSSSFATNPFAELEEALLVKAGCFHEGLDTSSNYCISDGSSSNAISPEGDSSLTPHLERGSQIRDNVRKRHDGQRSNSEKQIAILTSGEGEESPSICSVQDGISFLSPRNKDADGKKTNWNSPRGGWYISSSSGSSSIEEFDQDQAFDPVFPHGNDFGQILPQEDMEVPAESHPWKRSVSSDSVSISSLVSFGDRSLHAAAGRIESVRGVPPSRFSSFNTMADFTQRDTFAACSRASTSSSDLEPLSSAYSNVSSETDTSNLHFAECEVTSVGTNSPIYRRECRNSRGGYRRKTRERHGNKASESRSCRTGYSVSDHTRRYDDRAVQRYSSHFAHLKATEHHVRRRSLDFNGKSVSTTGGWSTKSGEEIRPHRFFNVESVSGSSKASRRFSRKCLSGRVVTKDCKNQKSFPDAGSRSHSPFFKELSQDSTTNESKDDQESLSQVSRFHCADFETCIIPLSESPRTCEKKEGSQPYIHLLLFRWWYFSRSLIFTSFWFGSLFFSFCRIVHRLESQDEFVEPLRLIPHSLVSSGISASSRQLVPLFIAENSDSPTFLSDGRAK